MKTFNEVMQAAREAGKEVFSRRIPADGFARIDYFFAPVDYIPADNEHRGRITEAMQFSIHGDDFDKIATFINQDGVPFLRWQLDKQTGMQQIFCL